MNEPAREVGETFVFRAKPLRLPLIGLDEKDACLEGRFERRLTVSAARTAFASIWRRRGERCKERHRDASKAQRERAGRRRRTTNDADATERPTSVDEVDAIFRDEADSNRYRGILGVAEMPIVSADIVKDPRASVVDLESTQVVDGDLVKVLSWYDNEWGYAAQMMREANRMAAQ